MSHFFQSDRKAKGETHIRLYPFSCSPVKLVGSTANNLVSHSPFKEHQANSVWETNLLEKINGGESISLQTAVNDGNFARKEIQTSEVQPDLLGEKIVEDPLFSQGSKTKQVSNINQIFIKWKYI